YFQAEDGIRDRTVTGVQTCALPIWATELYFALQGASSLPMGLPHNDGMFYLQKAAHWANAYLTGPNDAADTLNLYDVSGLAHFEIGRASCRERGYITVVEGVTFECG